METPWFVDLPSFASFKEAPAAYGEYTADVGELPTTLIILASEITAVYGDLVASLKPSTITSLNGRLERGLTMALAGHVYSTQFADIYMVKGKQRPFYKVSQASRTCDCPDCGCQTKNFCKHRIAVYLVTQALAKSRPAVQVNQMEATS